MSLRDSHVAESRQWANGHGFERLDCKVAAFARTRAARTLASAATRHDR